MFQSNISLVQKHKICRVHGISLKVLKSRRSEGEQQAWKTNSYLVSLLLFAYTACNTSFFKWEKYLFDHNVNIHVTVIVCHLQKHPLLFAHSRCHMQLFHCHGGDYHPHRQHHFHDYSATDDTVHHIDDWWKFKWSKLCSSILIS